MITTVTLNAAIDKTYYLNRFNLGEVNRVEQQIMEPGGKGNNVAKVIQLLGGDVTATGFIAGSNGSFIENQLIERGIQTSFVRVPGESRTCLNIIDEMNGTSTEILEQGPILNESHLGELKENIMRLAAKSKIVVLSGSLPPGLPDHLYADFIQMINAQDVKTFLDASGAAFALALENVPHFIKPNEDELAHWLGRAELTEKDCIKAAEKLADKGISEVCVTRGSRGVIAFIEGVGYRVQSSTIEAINTVGCGDAFVAGFAFAEVHGAAPVERLQIAVASAAANAMSKKAGHIDYEKISSFLKQVKVDII